MEIHEAEQRGYYVDSLNGDNQLHSSVDPYQEAAKRLPDTLPDHERFILFGAGLGYLLHHIANKCQQPRVLVFEPNPVLLREGEERGIWNQQDFFQYYEIVPDDPRLMDAMFSFLPLEVLDEYTILRWEQYEAIEPEFFNRMSDQLRGLIQHHRRNLASMMEDGRTWLRNIRSNLSKLKNHQSPRSDSFQGSVAVVGAGPSLDDQIDWLRNNEENLSICSINTAGPILNKHDIPVDVHFAVDSNPEIHRDLLDSDVKHVMASPNVDPAVFEHFDSYTIFGLLSPLSNWFQTAPFIPTIPSKSAAIPSFVKWLSQTAVDHVYILGCDLGHRNGRFYARGTRREQTVLHQLNRFRHLPGWHLIEKPRDQDDPHFGQQQWVTLQSKLTEQLRIPTPTPDWWEHPANDECPNSKTSMFFQPVDKEAVSTWAEQQSKELELLLENPHKASDPWQQFWFWVHKLTEQPKKELDKWRETFVGLSDGALIENN